MLLEFTNLLVYSVILSREMKTRTRNYNTSLDETENKKPKSSSKVTGTPSRISSSKENNKNLKDNVELREKKNCRSVRKTNIKKSETDVKEIEENNSILPKRRGRKPHVKETTCSFQNKGNSKKSKADVEENCNTLYKTRGRKPKADAKITKKVSNNVQSKGKKSKPHIEKAENENYTLSSKSSNEKSEPDVGVVEKMISISPSKLMNKVLKVKMEIMDEGYLCFPSKIRENISKTKNNMQNKHSKDVEKNNTEILEDDSVNFLEEKDAKILDNSGPEVLERNNVEMQDNLKTNNAKTVTSDDDSDCPDEITFCTSRDDAMEGMKFLKNEISKIKNERKEIRKKIHDRNVLQKKQKIDKVAELQKRKLPPQLLEYISKLPKIKKNIDRREISPKVTSLENTNEDEECKHLVTPKDEDFISLHGNTEFRACYFNNAIRKPKSLAATAAEFKQRAFSGNKVKRESVHPREEQLLVLTNMEIEEGQEYKYLGVILASDRKKM